MRALGLGLALFCAAPSFAQQSFAGTWTTDFGALTLTQTGTMVTGTYDYNGPATLTGVIRGKTLYASYKEASGAIGKAELTIAADGKSFRGRWVSGSQMGPWNGKKQGVESEKPSEPKAINRSGSYKVGDLVEVWHNGNGQFAWMVSTILEINEGKYKVHYGGSKYNVTTVTEDKIHNEVREKAKAENIAKWPRLMDDIQPYRENLESFAHEHNAKWYVQSQVLPNSPELIKKAIEDLAAVEALMTGKYAGMTAVQSGFDTSVMQHPEAWLEIAKNRQAIAQGFAARAAKDKLRFQLLALNQIIKSVEDNDGFGLTQLGLDLVMGKREALRTKVLTPIKPLFEGVGLPVPTDLLTEWEATAETLVATAKRKATGTKPAGNYTNATFAAQVKEIWTKAWPERKIVKISFSRPDWFVTTNALGTPLYRHYGGMVQYRVAGFDYIIEQGFQRREDYQGGGKYTYRAAPYEPEIRIVKG
jgi:hypothetical protein